MDERGVISDGDRLEATMLGGDTEKKCSCMLKLQSGQGFCDLNGFFFGWEVFSRISDFSR